MGWRGRYSRIAAHVPLIADTIVRSQLVYGSTPKISRKMTPAARAAISALAKGYILLHVTSKGGQSNVMFVKTVLFERVKPKQ